MRDSNDHSKKRIEKLEKKPGQVPSESWENRRVREEVERFRQEHRQHPEKGRSAQDQLDRRQRIAERDSARHSKDFNVEKAIKVENVEIRTNPEGFIRKHLDTKLDSATEREIRQALSERDRNKGKIDSRSVE